MRNFTDKPKSAIPNTKMAFTSEDVPTNNKLPSSSLPSSSTPPIADSMRRANTNENLVNLEQAALATTPPEWAQKQLLMEMVNRSADGNRVTGDEFKNFPLTTAHHSSAFSRRGKAQSVILSPQQSSSLSPQQMSSSPPTISSLLAQRLGGSAPSAEPALSARVLTSSSSTSSLPISSVRRETPTSSIFENRLRLKREKEKHLARLIMAEEQKKAKDKEKIREAEERMKAKMVREQKQMQLVENDDDQGNNSEKNSPQSNSHNSPQNPTNLLRAVRTKIGTMNVKPTLPSIGLDEKLKSIRRNVKGFLGSTNAPSFPLAMPKVPKFRDKRKMMGRTNMPIKLSIVDDVFDDLERQRTNREDLSVDSRDGLSPISQRTGMYDGSANSSPAGELQKKISHRHKKRLNELRLATKSASELQLLVRALNQDVQSNNDAIVAAQQTCAKIRTEMNQTKTLFTVDIEATSCKVTRASMLGQQMVTTVKEIRAQLDTTRSATSSCSDQIKQLEVHVQKVQRAKKPSDTLMRYVVWMSLAVLLLYLIFTSRTCQMLVVVSVFVLAIRNLKERNATAAQTVLSTQEPLPTLSQQHHQQHIDPIENESGDLSSSGELVTPSMTPPSGTQSGYNSPKQGDNSGITMRRNHSDLVLQSLLNEDEFAEVFNDSPKLKAVREEDDPATGISPRSTRNKTNATNATANPLRGGSIRTSAKESVAMNLAFHNLNQMSLKIQQMQSGKP